MDNAAGTINAESVKENESGSEDDDNHETNDGSDSSRVVDSAITYARECLRTENYTEATMALGSVLEISKPNTTSFKMVVLHIAQLLKATQELKTSIDCMLSVYRSMPPPLSSIEGICVIARSYEQLQSANMARFWWKKLKMPASHGLGVDTKPDARLWEATADLLFDAELFVFSADFYAQALAAGVEKQFVPSNRFRYRFLFSLLAFVGPQGSTIHTSSCRFIAWSLAQWFRRRNGNSAHIRACFGDPHFYRMINVYFTSFPSVYRIVFAWLDGPAGRIARRWRRHWEMLHPTPKPVSTDPPSSSRAKAKGKKKPKPHLHSPKIRGKVSAPSLSPTRKPRISDRKYQILKVTKPRRTERNSDVKPRIASPAPSNNAPSAEEKQQFQNESLIEQRCKIVKLNALAKKSSDFEENSLMKRRLSVVKRLRVKHSSADPTTERPSSAGVNRVSSDEEGIMPRSSSTSLLDVYPLHLPKTEEFISSCGREPAFADLELSEVGEFARLAHYRARVLTGQHAPVNNLNATKVKPQWLQDLVRTVAFIETHQQRNLISGKVVVEGDSVAHLCEAHTRLVLMISTLCRQYTRDYGETVFTRRLRGITRKLVEWKFTRISEVIAALTDAKSVATQEENQRNLEFYHVHRS